MLEPGTHAREIESVVVVGLGSVGLPLTKFHFGEEANVPLGPTSKNRWAYTASKIVDEFMGLAPVA